MSNLGILVDDPYYSIKNAYSNSSGSALNPIEGGSPKKFKSFIDNDFEQKETASLRKGKLLHFAKLEDGRLHFSKVSKPTGKLGDVADKILELSKRGFIKEIASWEEQSGKKVNNYRAADFGLSPRKLGLIATARQKSEYYLNRNLSSVLKEILKSDILKYLNEINESKGKIGVNSQDNQFWGGT